MANQLKTALILDSRIADITDVESFGVVSSGQNITYQQYAALSASNSLITYQLQIPSESIVVDRAVLQNSVLSFQIAISGRNSAAGASEAFVVGDNVFDWGVTEAFGPFPLTQCFSTLQSTINNCSTSINIGDILPQMLQMTSAEDLELYNSTTASMIDRKWGTYSDAVKVSTFAGANGVNTTKYFNSNSNPLGAYSVDGADNAYSGRGAFPSRVVVMQYQADGSTFVSYSPIAVATDSKFRVYIQAEITEPIMLSPFLNCAQQCRAGFLGINTLTLNLNVNNTFNRVFRTAQTRVGANGLLPKFNYAITGGITIPGANWPANTGISASQSAFNATKLLCQFLTLQPSQASKMALRNIVEYTDYPRFITSGGNNPTLAPATYSVSAQSGSMSFLVPTTATITSNNIQLNQVPRQFIIVVAPPTVSQNPAYADAFCAITGIKINFNNKSGILASAQTPDLWKLSQKGGSKQSWEAFRGWAVDNQVSVVSAPAYVAPAPANNTPADIAAAIQASYNTIQSGVNQSYKYNLTQVPTVGSVLVIDSVDLGLEDFLSVSSLGQFNFQCNVDVANFQQYEVQAQLTIIAVNEGIFTTIAGSSSIYTGLLTREMTLSTKEQAPAVDTESYKRMVGGVHGNNSLSNAAKLIQKNYRSMRDQVPVEARMALQGLSGMGASGGKSRLSRHLL